MIDLIDDFLKDWIGELNTRVKVTFDTPNEAEDKLSVNLYLMEIVDDQERRHSTGRPPLQPSLRYLVTTTGDTFKSAHKMLWQVLDAALDRDDFKVEFEPASSQIWTAFKIAPRPSFVLQVPLHRGWPGEQIQFARGVEARFSSMITLQGTLVGDPGNLPVPRARVEMPSLNRAVYTDRDGQFSLPNVPSQPASGQWELRIEARGMYQQIKLPVPPTLGAPLTLTFNFNRVSLFGQLVAANDPKIMLSPAEVSIPELDLHTFTGPDGRFQLDFVPSSPTEKQLLVRYKSRQQTITIKETGTQTNPISIPFE